MNTLQCIIFDFGGVISVARDLPNDHLHTIAEALAEKYLVEPEAVVQITLDGWLKARTDPNQDDAFWQNIADALGISVKEVKHDFLNLVRPLLEVIACVRQLKKQYQIAMLSNQIENWHQILMSEWQITDLFDPIVTSYGEGIAKPDPEVYRRLLEKLQLPGESCLYIDDVEINLVPARELGMQTVLFTSPEQFLEEIKRFV
jgi:epoxide hydrolase-like predicted phosphatase